MKIFGWEIVPSKPQEDDKVIGPSRDTANNVSFTPELKDDGAVVVAAGGSYGTYVDLEGTVKSEAELVTKYREMSMHPEVETAMDAIVNEAIVVDQDWIVRLNTDKLSCSPKIKERLEEEFEEILDLLNFNNDAYEIFKRWYVDGRIYYHAIIDEKNPQLGLRELRYIDPRKIRKVREVTQEKSESGVVLLKTKAEYFIYSERGFPNQSGIPGSQVNNVANFTGATALKIATDSILHSTSGLMDVNNQLCLSYLHKAIKPLNQLRMLEDSTVIYCISRAPERRVWYVDVGNLPKAKAEQYLREQMVRHKNRLVYDASTGEVRDDRKFMTMLEDYWLARREGGKGTEVTTLPAGEHLGEMDHVLFFVKKLMKALSVPISRLDPESGMTLGRASEISRDEVQFSKFVKRLRKRFCQVFIKSMEKNLVLKGVCNQLEWADWSRHVVFEFQEDNHFAELKDAEILQGRIDLAQAIQPLVGAYYSHEFVRKNILRQSDEDIEDLDEQISQEQNDPQYQKLDSAGMPPMFGDGMGMDGGFPPDQFGPQPGDPNLDNPMPEGIDDNDENTDAVSNYDFMAKKPPKGGPPKPGAKKPPFAKQ